MPEKEEEEVVRGGTEVTVPRPIEDSGQSITIYCIKDLWFIKPETPSLA